MGAVGFQLTCFPSLLVPKDIHVTPRKQKAAGDPRKILFLTLGPLLFFLSSFPSLSLSSLSLDLECGHEAGVEGLSYGHETTLGMGVT